MTLEEAEANLEAFAAKWRKQYPSCVKSREENWEVLSTFFEYPSATDETSSLHAHVLFAVLSAPLTSNTTEHSKKLLLPYEEASSLVDC